MELAKGTTMSQREPFEVRWHGRGGQGAVVASRFLSAGAIRQGNYSQSFPEFGVERMGAPIRAFTRIHDAPIYLHCNVDHPDAVVVLDPTLLGLVDVTSGARTGGVILVNTPDDPSQVRKRLEMLESTRLWVIDATRIALDCINRPVANTAMVGALVRVTNCVSIDDVR